MVLVEILKVSLQIGASEIPLVSRVNEKSGRHPNTDVLFGGRNGSSYVTRIIMNNEDPHEQPPEGEGARLVHMFVDPWPHYPSRGNAIL
jgi:hypothetical protein